MNLHRWLATVFVILALVCCIQVATAPGQAPYAPYSRTTMTGGGDGGGDGMQRVAVGSAGTLHRSPELDRSKAA